MSSSVCDVCVVHHAEAGGWRDYIERLVNHYVANKGAAPLRLRSVDDSSLTKPGRSLPRSSVIVVILSPAHLDFLRRHPHVNYKVSARSRMPNVQIVSMCSVAW